VTAGSASMAPMHWVKMPPAGQEVPGRGHPRGRRMPCRRRAGGTRAGGPTVRGGQLV
jgi:hypothetical protein